MNKEIKYQSLEGGDFTTAQNRVTFRIPSDGVYDLSNSYINLNVEIDVVENDAVGGQGIYNMDMAWRNSANPGHSIFFNNVCLVRNANMRTANIGQVENIRRLDVLKSLMLCYKTSVEEFFSRGYENANQVALPRGQRKPTIFRNLQKEGVIKSTNNSLAPVKIPLGDIFDFCFQADELDTGKTGAIDIHLELNIDKVQAVFRDPLNAVAVEMKTFDDINAVGNANEITTKAETQTLAESPYHTGQKLVLTATGNGGAGNVNTKVVVQGIRRNEADGTISLAFETDWGVLAGGESYSDIAVATEEPASASLRFNFAEIVLMMLPMSSSPINQIDYSTFSTEETNGNNLTSFQNGYQVEPDCDNVIIAFPTQATDLVSQIEDIQDYRLRLDNEDLTDRNVEFKSPLYYDRINMTLTNMRMRLRNLFENVGNTFQDSNTNFTAELAYLDVIMSPLAQKAQSFDKLLQVNINCQGAEGVRKLILYKHLPRSLSI